MMSVQHIVVRMVLMLIGLLIRMHLEERVLRPRARTKTFPEGVRVTAWTGLNPHAPLWGWVNVVLVRLNFCHESAFEQTGLPSPSGAGRPAIHGGHPTPDRREFAPVHVQSRQALADQNQRCRQGPTPCVNKYVHVTPLPRNRLHW